MTNELTVHQQPEAAITPHRSDDHLANVQRLGKILSASGYFSDAREMAQAAVKVMAGEELGLAPVASMMGINIIKNKVALSANLMASQVKRHGYNYRIKSISNEGCVIEFIGKDGKNLGESSFTEKDAKDAGVYGEMYKKYARNMYFSRAMSNGVKWYCPEVTSGLPVYTPEELGAQVNSEGEILHQDRGGSQAAADAVAQRKITEMQAVQRPVEDKPSAPAPQAIQDMWARMSGGIKPTIEVFQALKSQLAHYSGEEVGEEEYRRILGKYGVEHSNQFKTTKPARECAREMFETIEKLTRQAESVEVA